MKTTIAIILFLTLITSCGKRVTNNSGVTAQPIVNQELHFTTCSYAQVQNRCLDYASNKLLAPRYFYYQACYITYTNCLRSNQVRF